MKGLNTDLQVLSIHMNFTRKIFNKASNYVTKLKGIKQVIRAKALAKKYQTISNFSSSFSRDYSQQAYPF